MPRRESETGTRRLRGSERRKKACELRLAHWNYEQIGEELGITKQAAHYHVKKALAELRAKTEESAEDIRSLELTRLDAIAAKLIMRSLKDDDAATDRLLRVMQRRADLTGIDAPQKIGGPSGGAIPFVGVTVTADKLKELSGQELDALAAVVTKLEDTPSADAGPDPGGESTPRR